MNSLFTYPKMAWRWLTSMRTALVLLFLLSIGAVPGVLLPQRNLNESKVRDYIATGGKPAEIYDKLQLFDVFSSQWFTAIYVLLFVSLIGCILPRTIESAKAYRQQPVRAPKNLARLPLHGAGHREQSLETIEKEIEGLFRTWRLAGYTAEEDRAGKRSFAAEKGLSREVANLVFHLGLVGILVTVSLGRLISYEGQVIVIADTDSSQFCNTAFANYDDYRWGALVDGTDLDPFCVEVKNFTATYHPNGQADDFTSDIGYAWGDEIFAPADTWNDYTLRVNHPLRLHGNRIYLQGHGFAPQFTVTWPNGETRTQMVQFRPDDLTYFLSSGVMRFDPPAGMYPNLFDRRQNQLAIQGLFAPTAVFSGENNTIMASGFPAANNPAVAIDIYRGDTGLDSGRSQSVFTLDTGQIHRGELQKIERVNLMLGESVTLADGTKVSFDGANEFVNLQISHDPTQLWVLVFTTLTLLGLVGSLTIKRRRVWVRLSPNPAGGTDIETGGLARTDRAGWGSEFHRINRRILSLPDPDDEDSN